MDKSVWGHAALALVATGMAYMAWTKPSVGDDSDTMAVVTGSADALTEIEWHDALQGTVLVQKKGQDVTVATRLKAHVGSASASHGEASDAKDGPWQTYPGTEQAQDMFKKLATLKAARRLEAVSDDQLKSFGLDNPSSKLTLRFGDVSQSVEVGSTTYGSGDYYTRGPDGNIYLLRSSYFNTLQHGALALQDRHVVGLDRAQWDRVVITRGTRRREVVQRHAHDASRSFVADPAEPDRKLELTSAWIERLLRLRVMEMPAQTPLRQAALQVMFLKDKEPQATLKLWVPGDTSGVGISSRFKTPVVVHKALVEGVLRDVDAVLEEGRSTAR